MNTKSLLLGLLAAFAITTGISAADNTRPAGSGRVGVYDSRAVSFAHFWAPQTRRDRDALVASARAAQSTGDEARLRELQSRINALQERSHLEVFSTAPAAEAMTALKDRLPALEAELGVDRLVSKWDEPALEGVPAADRVDVTDRLVREFEPDEKRLKTIEQMKTKAPLPLDGAKRMLAEGKL